MIKALRTSPAALIACAALLAVSTGAGRAHRPQRPTSGQPVVGGPDSRIFATPLLEGLTVRAGDDVDLHVFLERRDRPGANFNRFPVVEPVFAEITMPSMPGMPVIDPTVHDEGEPGMFGLSTRFPHGGTYRVEVSVPSLGSQGQATAAWNIEVADAGADPGPAAYTVDVRTPATEHAEAGKPVAITLTLHKRGDPAPYTDLLVVHEKPWHLMVASEDLRWFHHIHPARQPDGSYTITETFPAGGRYLLLSDVSPRGAGQQFVPASLDVTGAPFTEPFALTPGPRTGAFDGVSVGLTAPKTIFAHEDVDLTFAVTAEDGAPVLDLEPYLGAMGHLIMISQDGKRFVHSHPLTNGTVADSKSPAGSVRFVARFPAPGLYKMWGQFQRGGKVITSSFVVRAEERPAGAGA